MRLLVCGGRNYSNVAKLARNLNWLHKKFKIKLLIEGGADGADTIARQYATARGIPLATYKADWNKYGAAAGPIRNKQMLKEGRPDAVLAAPGGRGTEDMIAQAKAAGVKVYRVNEDKHHRYAPHQRGAHGRFEGRDARDKALNRVEYNSGEWFIAALKLIASLPRGWTGIAESFRPYITERIGKPHHHNVWGALTAQAVKDGLLTKTGERDNMKNKRSHARMSDVYERT